MSETWWNNYEQIGTVRVAPHGTDQWCDIGQMGQVHIARTAGIVERWPSPAYHAGTNAAVSFTVPADKAHLLLELAGVPKWLFDVLHTDRAPRIVGGDWWTGVAHACAHRLNPPVPVPQWPRPYFTRAQIEAQIRFAAVYARLCLPVDPWWTPNTQTLTRIARGYPTHPLSIPDLHRF